MASYTELSLLREEERVLMKIASNLNDQLNRLKVEELALQSMIRSSHANTRQSNETRINLGDASQDSGIVPTTIVDKCTASTINCKPLLDLEISRSVVLNGNEEEYEEDET